MNFVANPHLALLKELPLKALWPDAPIAGTIEMDKHFPTDVTDIVLEYTHDPLAELRIEFSQNVIFASILITNILGKVVVGYTFKNKVRTLYVE